MTHSEDNRQIHHHCKLQASALQRILALLEKWHAHADGTAASKTSRKSYKVTQLYCQITSQRTGYFLTSRAAAAAENIGDILEH